MSDQRLTAKKVMLVVHYAGVKRWYNEGVMCIWVNGKAIKFTIKDHVAYAVTSLSGDIEAVCMECVYVDNWGLMKYLSHSGHIYTDAVVSIDLMSKKVTVTEHHLSETNLAVICRMKSTLSYGELKKTRVSVSGCCPNLGGFDPKSAPETVKLPNSSFVYAVPECKCVDKCQYHHMYKFISNGCHSDPDAFLATTDGVMWEGPSFENRDLPQVLDTPQTGAVFPVLLGTWGSPDNILLEVPVSNVKNSYRKQCKIRKMSYGELKAEWAYKKPASPKNVSTPSPDDNSKVDNNTKVDDNNKIDNNSKIGVDSSRRSHHGDSVLV